MRVASATPRNIGPWTVWFSDDVVPISPPVRDEIESFVNDRYLPVVREEYPLDYVPNLAMRRANIPSPLIRLDMPPAYEGFRGVYEVEANTSGLGIAALLDVPIVEAAARALHALGIDEIGWFTAPSRADQHEDLVIFMERLAHAGVSVRPLAGPHDATDPLLPLWLRAGQEDIESGDIANLIPSCLLLHHDGGGNKRYLLRIGDATLLNDFSSNEDAFERYPDGFCLKPMRSWGTMDTHFWLPNHLRRSGSVTRTKIGIFMNAARSQQREWLVQKVVLPYCCTEGHQWIWRLFLGWNGERYEVIGGFQSGRKSLRIHGASDTVSVRLALDLEGATMF